MTPKWHENDTQFDPNLIKEDLKYDIEMTPKWHKNDTQFDPNLIKEDLDNDIEMTQKWHENDIQIESIQRDFWKCHGNDRTIRQKFNEIWIMKT